MVPTELHSGKPCAAPGTSPHSQWVTAALLTGFTAAAFAIHGYHLGIADDGVYLPAIKKLLNPGLYPHDADFFMVQMRATAMPWLLASSIRLSHVPLPWAEFAWQFLAIFLLLLGCYRVALLCFDSARDRWGAVALVTAFLTFPVAGTAISLADQHLHPRTIATALILFAVAAALDRRKAPAAAWSAAAFAIHPMMAVFGITLAVLIFLPWERPREFPASAALAANPWPFLARPTAAWREAIATRRYYFLFRWPWYAWCGIFAPLGLLWWFARLAKKYGLPNLGILARCLIVFSALNFAGALIVSALPPLEIFLPLQPMRFLHLVYLLTALFAGGLLSRFALRDRPWRWALLFLPVCVGMFLGQRFLFPASRHIDWPWAAPRNKWVQAFQWVRENTPQDAYFAIDPNYMSLPGEDQYGFRALAERSQLADYSKDASVVTEVPILAPRWQQEVHAIDGFDRFTIDDFLRLQQRFGVDWTILEEAQANSPGLAGLDCPYRNEVVAVCRIPMAPR